MALNANAIEGDEHDALSITVTPLPVPQNIEILAGNARITVMWDSPIDTSLVDSTLYAGYGYFYEIYDADGDFVKSTNLTQTHIPDLDQGVEYCYTVRSVSLGGYGYSEYSESLCAIPVAPFGESLEWGIQIIAKLTDFNGNPITYVDDDEFNLIGVDPTATDGFDAELDVPEPSIGGVIEFHYFSHIPSGGIQWGVSLLKNILRM